MSFTLSRCEKHGKYFDEDRGEWCPLCIPEADPNCEWFGRPCMSGEILTPGTGTSGAVNSDVLGYPDNNPKTQFGAAKIPLHLVPPSAIHALANAFADGAAKYGPYNWREFAISSSVYYAACMRHLFAWWDGEDLAQDSGKSHIDHAMACLAMIKDGQSVGKLNDDRPPKGAAARMQAEYLASSPTKGAQKGRRETVEYCGDCGADLLESAHSPHCLRGRGD